VIFRKYSAVKDYILQMFSIEMNTIDLERENQKRAEQLKINRVKLLVQLQIYKQIT